ncbi:hypothetical protein BDN72DRAFT_957178 [Pluteus cervinus]|uniref:Uncharacterized protein n=1 Tax=Pluteus cervinus TaxID=181527 RepID=A0ACD3B4V1_9AGAR|nr:hypothetical protein BDN72DRAFT_957178 [Pluteus cervinus]
MTLRLHILFLLFFFLLAPTHSSPLPPSHAKRELPPSYHIGLNLVWATVFAVQSRCISYILNAKQTSVPSTSTYPPLDKRSRDSYTLILGAILARFASHVFTAGFVALELPYEQSTGLSQPKSSLIGTFADLTSWVVDLFLFAAVFRCLHDQQPRNLRSFITIEFTHDSLGRLLLASFAITIFGLTVVSYVYPGPSPAGYNPLRSIYAIYLAINLFLCVDCIAWGPIMSRRQKKKEVVYPPMALGASFTGWCLVSVWSLRFFQHVSRLDPHPFVLNFLSQTLMNPFLYSFTFCILMMSRSEVQKYVIGFMFLTLVLLYGILYIFEIIIPK